MTGVQPTFINGLIDASLKSSGLCPLIPKMWVEHGFDRIQNAPVYSLDWLLIYVIWRLFEKCFQVFKSWNSAGITEWPPSDPHFIGNPARKIASFAINKAANIASFTKGDKLYIFVHILLYIQVFRILHFNRSYFRKGPVIIWDVPHGYNVNQSTLKAQNPNLKDKPMLGEINLDKYLNFFRP